MVALCHDARPNAAENACMQACMRVVPAPVDEAHPDRALRQSTLCRNMSSLWNQYLVLNGRAVAAYTRNPANMAGRTILAIFVAVFAGMVFMNPPAGWCEELRSPPHMLMQFLLSGCVAARRWQIWLLPRTRSLLSP